MKKWMIVGLVTLVFSLSAVVFLTEQYKVVTLVDGEVHQVFKTKEKDVKGLLNRYAIDLIEEDQVYPNVDEKLVDGMVVTIDRAKEIRVTDGLETMEVKTTQSSVRKILEELDIQLSAHDLVSPGLTEGIGPDKQIVITRMNYEEITLTEVLPFGTTFIYDEKMTSDEKLVQEGLEGKETYLLNRTYRNGDIITEERIGLDYVPPQEEIIKVRKKPLLVLEDGRYFTYSAVYTMSATAYDLSFQSTGKLPGHPHYGITYSGTYARPGVVAVDKRVIPLGAHLYVKSLDYTKDYGFSYAEDTGSAIKGNKIDLFIADHSRAMQYGRRRVRVYVLEEEIPEDYLTGYQNRSMW